MWSSGRSEAALESALPVPIVVRHVRRAKRLRLRLDEATGALRLTCPWRMSRQAALRWALEQREWIESQLARAPAPEPFAPGAAIPIEGVETIIAWSPHAPRAPVLSGGELRCGGPEAGIARRVETYLKRRAMDIMAREVAEFAAAAGLTARGVSIGDAATRWGSCSSYGRIRLNWRLILAPPFVRRYVVAHEVAHLAHLHHGPDFKALEAQLFGPAIPEAKAALRRIGPRLRRIGRNR